MAPAKKAPTDEVLADKSQTPPSYGGHTHGMTNPFHIHHYPVFEKGVFENHPALFDRFIHQAPDPLKREYHKARQALQQDEGTITWPVITGPGFSGGTHPGADNVLTMMMVNTGGPLYNSDCLYVNPSQRVFAISDAPGVTTSSRKLLVTLDRHLQAAPADDLGTIVNDLNKKTKFDDGATLSLIYVPRKKSGATPDEALAFVAGDTYLFHGSILQRRLTRIEGNPEFMATPHVHFEPERIHLAEGDFFIIASDGILSIRAGSKEARLEEVLLQYVNSQPESFAFSAISSCNTSSEERIYDRVITRFGGSDNVSALLVYPEKLIDINDKETFILGGYIMGR